MKLAFVLAERCSALLVSIAIFLPPLAVHLKTSNIGQTVINLILSFLFYFPGLIHALYFILKK